MGGRPWRSSAVLITAQKGYLLSTRFMTIGLGFDHLAEVVFAKCPNCLLSGSAGSVLFSRGCSDSRVCSGLSILCPSCTFPTLPIRSCHLVLTPGCDHAFFLPLYPQCSLSRTLAPPFLLGSYMYVSFQPKRHFPKHRVPQSRRF